MKSQIQLFEEKKVRTVWDEESEEWYFSIVDVVEVLTGTDRPRKYWNDLKLKLQKEGSELSEKIGQLKMKAPDGKMRLTDVANTDQLFRLIQSIPSPKAEPFKLWIAQIAKQGGEIARNARMELEAKTGQKVVSPLNAKKGILKNRNKEIE
jgi:prophage antirepressor-like protein